MEAEVNYNNVSFIFFFNIFTVSDASILWKQTVLVFYLAFNIQRIVLVDSALLPWMKRNFAFLSGKRRKRFNGKI